MPYTKRIVCLANSRKYKGSCVAGKEIMGNAFGGWVRPVSKKVHGELTPDLLHTEMAECLASLILYRFRYFAALRNIIKRKTI